MKKLINRGLMLAIVMALALGTSAWAQQSDAERHDSRPMIVTVVSADADDVVVRDQDGERMQLVLAADMPTLERDLQKGDVVKLWTEENEQGELVAQVEFAEVAVIKPHVTTRETTDPIADSTDPEAVPSETDPVVVDPALTAEAEAGEVDVTYEENEENAEAEPTREAAERETERATAEPEMQEPASQRDDERYTSEERDSLPGTASNTPLAALLGVLAVAGAIAIRFAGRVV